jgi:hypothetical protein
MELFWYTTECTRCKEKIEHSFTPSGANYAEKYHDFVSSIAPSRFVSDYVNKHCASCRCLTKQEVLHYAPAYTGVE